MSKKKPVTELTLSAYWQLRKSPKIIELRELFILILNEEEAMKLVFSPPIDWDIVAKKIHGSLECPFYEELEEEFKSDLSMARFFYGQIMLKSLRKDWLVQGHRIYFQAEEPLYDDVAEAVSEFLLRRPLWEQ